MPALRAPSPSLERNRSVQLNDSVSRARAPQRPASGGIATVAPEWERGTWADNEAQPFPTAANDDVEKTGGGRQEAGVEEEQEVDDADIVDEEDAEAEIEDADIVGEEPVATGGEDEDEDEDDFADRDMANDQADRAAWAEMIASSETVVLPLVGFGWFNLKLWVGHLMSHGRHPMISPPSWRFLKIPLLPDVSASVAIFFVDLLIVLVLVPLIVLALLQMAALAYAINHPIQAFGLVQSIFGSFSSIILKWVGL